MEGEFLVDGKMVQGRLLEVANGQAIVRINGHARAIKQSQVIRIPPVSEQVSVCYCEGVCECYTYKYGLERTGALIAGYPPEGF